MLSVTAFITTVNRLKIFVTETIWKMNSLSEKLIFRSACCYNINHFKVKIEQV